MNAAHNVAKCIGDRDLVNLALALPAARQARSFSQQHVIPGMTN
jgi:hypothetical protein